MSSPTDTLTEEDKRVMLQNANHVILLTEQNLDEDLGKIQGFIKERNHRMARHIVTLMLNTTVPARISAIRILRELSPDSLNGEFDRWLSAVQETETELTKLKEDLGKFIKGVEANEVN